MTTLTIRRLGAEATDPELTRVQQLLHLVADHALEKRQATYEGLSGEWCVRRLHLELDLAPDEPDSTAADRWAALIAGTIRDLVPDGSNVLHFRSRSRLLLDLVVGLARRDLSRAWAWRQAGLLADIDPDPAAQPVAALLAALGREPRLAMPVLVGAVEQEGVRAVHDLLGPIGWAALADLVRPGWRAVLPVAPGVVDPVAEQRAAAVLAASTLAPVLGSVDPAPDEETWSAWAVLLLAEVDPAADPGLLPFVRAALAPEPLSKGSARGAEGTLLELVEGPETRASTGSARGVEGTRGSAGRTRGMLPELVEGPEARAPTGSARGAKGTLPELVDGSAAEASTGSVRMSSDGAASSPASTSAEPDPGAPTNWAGLLFVLNAAAAAGLPDAIDIDLRLAGRPLRWVLHQLALRLVPVAADDPAALALAGLTPAMPVPAGPAAEPLEEQALDQHAAEWAAAVDQVLEHARHPEDDSPRPTLWSLARRPGRIVADPGWIEVQLSLDEVDLLVRRAGLDVDPGWLGWLGTVVVFRYV